MMHQSYICCLLNFDKISTKRTLKISNTKSINTSLYSFKLNILISYLLFFKLCFYLITLFISIIDEFKTRIFIVAFLLILRIKSISIQLAVFTFCMGFSENSVTTYTNNRLADMAYCMTNPNS
jgi:hypothetical protein